MLNCAGGMTIVQLGADMCNEGRADGVQTSVDSVDKKRSCLHSVTH